MEKQYSVKFFTSFLEALQKVCRDFVDFEDSIELSGYLSLEIDNVKKERYVLSEMLNSSGNVISESYCTKAFKTVRKYQQQSSGRENIMPRSQTVMNRSQRDSHHSYITDSHHQNSSSSYVNYKDHSSDSRVPKQWGHDVYGSNSRISPLRGSGHQFGDSGTGTHELKTSTPKRSLSAIVIDDAPSNKRGRSDSVPDDKSLSEMTSQQGMCKLDADSMQTSFSDTSHSQTTPQMPAASSSAQSSQANNNSNNNNHNISSQASSSHQNSESIRLPLQMTIKDEPDIPCVDIDLSELDSADSMGGSDSGSGYPSAEGTSSGAYRMAANNQGTSETYQTTAIASAKNGSEEEAMAICSSLINNNDPFNNMYSRRVREANFQCEICHRTYTHMKSLNRHKVSHVYSIMCRKCTIYFDSEEALNTHNKLKHSPVQCAVCGKTFSSISCRKNHQKSCRSFVEGANGS